MEAKSFVPFFPTPTSSRQPQSANGPASRLRTPYFPASTALYSPSAPEPQPFAAESAPGLLRKILLRTPTRRSWRPSGRAAIVSSAPASKSHLRLKRYQGGFHCLRPDGLLRDGHLHLTAARRAAAIPHADRDCRVLP